VLSSARQIQERNWSGVTVVMYHGSGSVMATAAAT